MDFERKQRRNMNKDELRKEMKLRRRTLSASRILFYSALMTDKLLKEEVYQNCDMVLAYYSISAEVSMDYLFEQAWQDGKKIGLPVCLENHEMEFRYYDRNTVLRPGIYGIPEPLDSTRIELNACKPLFLVPGVVFDESMNRIGYGGGYYDRFMKKYPDVPRVMLAYEMQKTDRIPADTNDVPVNLILTETARYE